MELSDIISIAITTATRTPSQAGFGIGLLISYSAAWLSDVVRTYANADAVAVDFATTTVEYKAAARYFSQNPRPTQLLIGKGTLKPSQQYEMTPVVANLYTYSMKVNGTTVSYTSDGSATNAEINGALKTAIDALAITGLTVSLQAANATLRLLMTAGLWLDVESNDPNMPLVQNHADPGIATDLAAIKVANNTWYALLTTFNSKLMVDAAGAWCETAKKLYVVQTVDSAVRDTAISGTDDVAESTRNAALRHTSIWYSKATGDFLDAGLVGAVLPLLPGSETWAFKEVTGVPAGAYTGTQRTNMTGKNANFYEPTAGLNITWEGKTAQGQYIDTTRFVDWLEARIAESIFGALANAKKIPYTAKGIEAIAGALRQVLAQASKPPIEGITPDFIITTPAIGDVPAADKATRTLNNLTFSATLTGAIHKVALQGTISV